MGRWLRRAFAAHFRAGRTLFALTLLGVALGVASVLSIQILNRNALGAFEGGLQAVSGEADLTVLPLGPVLDEAVLARVIGTPGVAAAWPARLVDVAIAGREPLFLQIVGADLLEAARIPWSGARPRGDLGEALATPGWVAVTPELARERGWDVGSRFEVSLGSLRVPLVVGALVDFRKVTPLAGTRLAVMDLAQVQGLFGARGELTQIDVKAAPGVDPGVLAARLDETLRGVAEARTPEQRTRQAADLMGAFRLNLTALSLISLFVGGFLIYVATQASLVRRRPEFGLLRSLGATPAQVLGVIVAEVLVLGALGTAIGLPLGWVAARANVATVSATLSNLYLLQAIDTLHVPWWIALVAAAIGAGGALAGGLWPAIDVGRRDTRALLAPFDVHARLGGASSRLGAAGAALVAATAALAFGAGEHWRPAGFVVAIGLLLAVPLVAPWLLRATAPRLSVRSFGVAYGLRGLGVRLGTTAFAVAALAVAVSMLVGITLMVGSFRRTVELWIDASLHADVYITSTSWQRARREATLDPALTAALASLPGVAAVDRLRQVQVDAGGRRIVLGGADLAGGAGAARFAMLEGNPREALSSMLEGEAALVSEPLARKAGLRVGDVLTVGGPDGPVSFPIAGVFYDYSSAQGGAVVGLHTLDRRFGVRPVTNVALYAAPGVGAEELVDRVRAAFPEAPLLVRSNRTLREEVFAIFDQTFAVTRLLQAMALLIAACGITLTLLILARERVSELALYRALGAGRGQIFRVFLGQGIGIAAYGLLLGSVAGVALAMVLVFLINRVWFGWTIAVYWPWRALVEQAGTILAAAALASVYPALRASRTPATELSRDDL